MTYQIEEGDLIAYLDGDIEPQMEKSLQNSPELRSELDRLTQTARILVDAPKKQTVDDKDLVDVITGQSTANQRLMVAAARRGDPAVDAYAKELEAEYDALTKTPQPFLFNLQIPIPVFLADPMTAALGLLSNADQNQGKSYQVVELQAQIALRIVPLANETWKIEGRITQKHEAVCFTEANLMQGILNVSEEIVDHVQSDEYGFFAFNNLEEGIYHISVTLPDGSMLIQDLMLEEGAED